MNSKTVPSEIACKNANFKSLAERIIKYPDLLPQVFEGLNDDTARVRYGSLKMLRMVSEKRPSALYPEMERFIQLLDSENTILKWGAIIIVGNLAVADSERKIDRILNQYLRPISEHVMITAANVIGGAGKIARAKPYLADEIVQALLPVEHARYETDECRNVALGHAIQAFDRFFECIKDASPVLDFVNRQLSNSRNAVRGKAAKFLKRHFSSAARSAPGRCSPSPDKGLGHHPIPHLRIRATIQTECIKGSSGRRVS